MKIIELETPDGMYPAHVVSTRYGTHYFNKGRASVADEVADELEKNGVAFKVVKADHPGGGVGSPGGPARNNSARSTRRTHQWGPGVTGDPYNRALASASIQEGQEPALNPSGADESKAEHEAHLDEIDRAHAGLPNQASGAVRGTDNAASVDAAKEESKPRTRSHK